MVCTWKILSATTQKKAAMKEKDTIKGIRRKVVLPSVIINAFLFSDILASVKVLSFALQNNLFNIVDAVTKSLTYTKIC